MNYKFEKSGQESGKASKKIDISAPCKTNMPRLLGIFAQLEVFMRFVLTTWYVYFIDISGEALQGAST